MYAPPTGMAIISPKEKRLVVSIRRGIVRTNTFEAKPAPINR